MVISTTAFPALAGLNKIMDQLRHPDRYEDEQLAEEAAEAQVKEERSGGGVDFWKVLEGLATPQRAVAGVIYDALNGGDFNPWDRVKNAFSWDEKHSIKDSLDVIFPGKWSNVNMPDFLGGKNTDWVKGGVGFLGDIFTDPLLFTGFLSMAGKTVKAGEVAAEYGAFREILGKAGLIAKTVDPEVARLTSAKGVAIGVAQNQLRRKTMLDRTAYMMREALQNPEEWSKTHIYDKGLKDKFFEEVVEPLRTRGIKVASPKLSERLAEGESHIAQLQLRLPIIGKMLGFPEKDLSLLPHVANKWAAKGVEAIGNVWDGISYKGAIPEIKQIFQKTFSRSTGDKVMDFAYIKAAGMGKFKEAEYTKQLDRAVQAYKGHYDEQTMGKIRDYLQYDYGRFGQDPAEAAKKLMQEPQHIQDAVREFSIYYKQQLIDNNALPMIRINNPLLGPLSLEKSYFEMRKMLRDSMPKEEWKMYKKEYPTLQTLRRKADKFAKMERVSDNAEDYTDAYNRMLNSAINDNLSKGEMQLNTSFLKMPTGYAHGAPTPEIDDVFKTWFKSSHIIDPESGIPMHDHIKRQLLKRKGGFAGDVGQAAIDQGWRAGELPVSIWDSIAGQAFEAYRTRKMPRKARKAFEKWVGVLDPAQRSFYVRDPSQAAHMHMFDSVRSYTSAQAHQDIIRFTSHVMSPEDIGKPAYWIGSEMKLLSPRGMEVYYGHAWKEALKKDGALEAYEALVKDKRLMTGSPLDSLFLDITNPDEFTLAAGNKIPIHSIPRYAMDEANKVAKKWADPEAMGAFKRNWDKITNFWKITQLAFYPAYFARNAITNMWQLFIGDSFDPESLIWATKAMFKGGHVKAGWYKSKGPAIAWDSAEDLGVKSGGKYIPFEEMQRDIINYEIVKGVGKQEVKIKARQSLKDIAERGIAGKAWEESKRATHNIFNAGNVIEGISRLTMYHSALKSGMTKWQARSKVVKYFFNYDEMSAFDNVMLKGMPFYRWSRNNIPLQIEALIKTPRKMAQAQRMIEAFQSPDMKDFPKEKLPRWANENFGIPLRINNKTGDVEMGMLGGWLGMSDLNGIVGTNPLRGLYRKAEGLAHPLPRAAMEWGQNRSWYTDRPIEEFPGEPVSGGFLGVNMRKKAAEVLKSLPFGRALNETDKLFFQKETAYGGQMSWPQKIFSASGVTPKIKTFNVGQLEERYQFDVNMRKATIKRKLAKAKKYGDRDYIEYLKAALEDAAY